MGLVEAVKTGTEIGVRQIWFRMSDKSRLRVRQLVFRRKAPAPVIDVHLLRNRLEEVLPGSNPLVMVHSSADGFRVAAGRDAALSGSESALLVLETLLGRVGAQGTLCMPTHPLYKEDRGFLEDKRDLQLVYRPMRTPSSVGLLTEMFRRYPQTLRSEHPLCSLAARGPRAAQLLHDNLNDREPLPHGSDSGYYRFCRAGGTVIGIGLPLYRFSTVLHCAEEVADAHWPVSNFFRPRRFIVEHSDGTRRHVRVRERRPEFVRSLALGRLRRDALMEGVLSEYDMSGVRLDVLDARGFFEMMLARQRHGPYPFVLPELAAVGARHHLPGEEA